MTKTKRTYISMHVFAYCDQCWAPVSDRRLAEMPYDRGSAVWILCESCDLENTDMTVLYED